MSTEIVLQTEVDGVEFFTVTATGESGMSIRGLARLCDVDESSIRNLLENMRGGRGSKWLKSVVGKELYLMEEYRKKGGAVKIIRSEICAAIIKHYAFSGREAAQFAMEKFVAMGINTWIQGINGWKRHRLPEEELVENAIALLEHKKRILAIEAQNKELEARQKALEKKQQLEHDSLKANQDVQKDDIEDLKLELSRYSNGHGSWYSIVAWWNILNREISLKEASNLGRKASSLCRKLGITPEPIKDPRFGKVNLYPESILKHIS